VRVNTPDEEAWELSVACAVNVDVPAADGVPEITPPFSASPVGKAPPIMLQLYGGAPPVPVSACEYGVPAAPLVRAPPLIVSGVAGPVTIRLKADAAEIPFESDTRTVKL
jgi:hypothetical protein